MSTTPVIAVTGANGYVGSVIVDALTDNAEVICLVRNPKGSDEIRWSFGCDVELLARTLRDLGVTHIVHAAWDMRANSEAEMEKSCVAGSRDLLSASQKAGVQNYIFISTISAFDGARSAYGRSKVKVEELFRQAHGLVLRLGLVYGNGTGGTYSSLKNIVRNARIVPLIGDGKAPQYLLDAATLGQVIRRAVRGEFNGETRPLTLAYPKPIAFRDLLLQIARSERRQIFLVPVPWRLLYLAISTAEQLGIKLNFRSDSILSFIYQNHAPDFGVMQSHSIEPIEFSTFYGRLSRCKPILK
jgi:nucleoside-diphosphate-sugar epimerase